MFKKESGFSIVELLIVVGGLAGLALVSMSVTKMNTKSTAKFGQDSDIQSIVNELASELANPAICVATLGGNNALASTTTINSINGKYPTVAAGGTGGYGNSNLKIDTYTLLATQAEVDANTSYLIITYFNKNILAGDSGPATLTKKIKLNITSSANIISDCRAIATTSEVWARGAGASISYVSGNVGVGTPVPTERLEVNGTLKTTDFQLTSDRQFKTQIKDLDTSVELGKILKLRPVAFTWKENEKKDQGFIAQELRKEFPLLVEGSEGKGRGLAIKYFSVISSVVASVQEIFHKQVALEEKIAIQDKQIQELIRMNLELQEKMEKR